MFFFLSSKTKCISDTMHKGQDGKGSWWPFCGFLTSCNKCLCVCVCASERERLSDREVVWLWRLLCVFIKSWSDWKKGGVSERWCTDISSGTCTFYCLLVLMLRDLAFSVPSRARQLHACVSVHISHIVWLALGLCENRSTKNEQISLSLFFIVWGVIFPVVYIEPVSIS